MSHPLTLQALLVILACACLLTWWIIDANLQARRDLREQRDSAESEPDVGDTSPVARDQAAIGMGDDALPD